MHQYIKELETALGSSMTADPQICRAYNHDLGEMPAVLMMLFNRTPSCVVLPKNAKEAADALGIAHRHGIPVTVRAQASSGYGGSMPTRGGMLLDMSRMKAVLSVDAEGCTCDVEAGVVWTDLEDELAKSGLACRICPTSGPSSTVGGMFAMGGMGIGSTKYGDILSVTEEIDVIDPDGTTHTVRGSEMSVYAFSQGTVGVITRIRLRCRRRTDLIKYAFCVSHAKDVGQFCTNLQCAGAYSVSVLNAEYCAMQSAATGHQAPVYKGFFVLAVFEDAVDDYLLSRLEKAYSAYRLPEKTAEEEWNARFYPMRIKRNGPALLVGEYLISAPSFGKTWEEILSAMKNDKVGCEAFVGNDGSMSVLVYVQDSAEDFLALFRMGKAMIPLHIAARHGGTVYATGLWFNSQTAKVLGKQRMAALMKKKRQLDPKNRFNSGKCCGCSVYYLPFALLSYGIWIGTKLMAPIASVLKARPRRISGHEE